MSEEEKKAIEYLTKYIHWETYGERSLETDIETTLNLIDKQQKEIKELKEELEIYKETENDYEHELARKDEEIEDYKAKLENEKEKNNTLLVELASNNYISKNKIKKELKDLEEIKYSAITDIGQAVYNANIALLKRLLEE